METELASTSLQFVICAVVKQYIINNIMQNIKRGTQGSTSRSRGSAEVSVLTPDPNKRDNSCTQIVQVKISR